jgi:hypothetical protein
MTMTRLALHCSAGPAAGAPLPAGVAAGPGARPTGRHPLVRAGVATLALATLVACDRFAGQDNDDPAALFSAARPVAAPVDALRVHLDGFQFRNGDLGSQQRVHQYCGELQPEVLQCALFDGTGRDARLTGVEYVISERLFSELPEDEKPYWHSQVHQVKAGTLLAPELSEDADHALAGRLMRTYAKTWQMWPAPRTAPVPLGVPQLMMGFTRDGQLDPVLLAERDRQIGVANAEKRRLRADLPDAQVVPGADAWQQGRIAQVQGAVDRGPRAP